MARELALALKHIHENNIIHRDIKTLNIFLTREKKIKVKWNKKIFHEFLCKKTNIKLGDLGVSKIFNSDIAL